MYSFHQQLTRYLLFLVLLISIVHSFRIINDFENENNLADAQLLNNAQQHVLEQILTRRSFYDPAFSDSWSNYFEKKRSLFDPAYNDWSNTFKRSTK